MAGERHHDQETLENQPFNQYQPDSNGAGVKAAQEQLKELGYYKGEIDGVLGPHMEAAIRDFQSDYKLKVDGIIGPATRAKLAEVLSSSAVFQLGSVDVEVKTLQRQLKLLTQYPGEIDGIFGPLTDAGVKRFQEIAGLVVDGRAGEETRKRLRDTLLGEVRNPGIESSVIPTGGLGQAYGITKAQLKEVGWDQTHLDDTMMQDLNQCLERYQITNPQRIQHFISQCSIESGFGKYRVEQSWDPHRVAGAQYEGRADLGNTQAGDGSRYKGAGYIQLIGRKNYQSFANNVNDPKIMDGADYVAQKYPWTSAGFYWDREQFNPLCDQGASVEAITKKVNCGSERSHCHPNGLPERKACFEICRKVFNKI